MRLPLNMEVLRPVPKQSLGILLTKGTLPLKDNTTPSTLAGLLLFPGKEGSPLLLQVKKPTSCYKPQCSSARLKPPSRFCTEYSPSAGQKMPATTLANSSHRKRLTVYSPTAGLKSFLEKKEQSQPLGGLRDLQA
ncbi:hypothetical protein Taro_008969 [Colocasia esculenta]|uniref:Uncharacterized protein n=1 Tax=Colocasia esculenta TaxID=4460 RepID=A0A843U8M8_COLES|nr:hypothetical protein [Colocasia esculenta]